MTRTEQSPSTTPEIQATVVILTKNEENNVELAIRSSRRFARVLVVDSRSTDRTAEIAQDLGADIVQFDWDGAYPKKKEWALVHCDTDWVVYLDADETISPELASEIATVVLDPGASAFEVPVRYHWVGSALKHGHQVRKRIGIRKSKAHWPHPNDLHVTNMWEVEGHYQPIVDDGECRQLQGMLHHEDKDDLYDYFARHNRYSDWEAHMLIERDRASLEARTARGRIAANLPAKPLIFFLYSYLLRLGFLDGRAGFNYALALSFYYWQIGQKKKELLDRGKVAR